MNLTNNKKKMKANFLNGSFLKKKNIGSVDNQKSIGIFRNPVNNYTIDSKPNEKMYYSMNTLQDI